MVSIELILTATIVVIGLIVGMTATRDAMLSELSDTAGAIQDLNQCFQFQGIVGHAARTCGSDFIDSSDFCDAADDEAGIPDNCILISAAFNDESARTRRAAAPAIGRARAAMAVLLERRRAAGGG